MGNHVPGKSHAKTYWYVFAALAVLTLIEIYIPSIKSLGSFQKGSSLAFLALGKACIVAYFYMHLNEEKKILKYIAAIPLSAAIYTTVVVLESIYR
jgi:cytochrome c oxidase subunit IV